MTDFYESFYYFSAATKAIITAISLPVIGITLIKCTLHFYSIPFFYLTSYTVFLPYVIDWLLQSIKLARSQKERNVIEETTMHNQLL